MRLNDVIMPQGRIKFSVLNIYMTEYYFINDCFWCISFNMITICYLL